MTKRIPVFCVVLVILLQVFHVSAKLFSSSTELPEAPSSAVDKGMEAVLAACDFASRYKLAYVANGYFALKEFKERFSKSDKLCDNCSKDRDVKSATKSNGWTDKLVNFVTSGFTTKEGMALVTFMGASVCEMAESYRKE